MWYNNSWKDPRVALSRNTYVLDSSRGDVNGDRVMDNVYLVGEKPWGVGSPFVDNITVLIQNGWTGQVTQIPLKFNAGYNPQLFLGDFTGDKVADIYVSIESGGSGGYGFFYIYSFLNNQVRQIFDFEQFNQASNYRVTYRDYYAVDVANLATMKLFGIDIYHKGAEYLLEIYDENGKLKNPIEGEVLALSELFPIDVNKDGTFELEAVQRVIGRFNADTLGYVQTYLRWNGSEFVQFDQEASVRGTDLIAPAVQDQRQLQGPPSIQPPSFTPTLAETPDASLTAVDPGAIKGCLHRFVYIWLKDGKEFWLYLVYVGNTSLAGWRFVSGRWRYFGVDLKDIQSFLCL